MVQKTTTFPRWQVVLAGIGWLAGVGLLSSNRAIAQAIPQSTPAEVAIPEADPTNPADFATPEPAPESIAIPESFVPKATLSTVSPDVAQSDTDYIAPDAVVFSERSTGCERTLAAGDSTPDGICAPEPAATPILEALPSASTEDYATVNSVNRSATIQMVPLPGLTASQRDYYRRKLSFTQVLRPINGMVFPLSIPAIISSAFGWRIHPISSDYRFHAGTDLAAPMGTPVLAAYAGQVAIANVLGGYGLTVALDHAKGTQQTLYAHLSEVFVKPGDTVKPGDVIGRVGSTGNSTGPHLHFELRQLTPDGWIAVDAGAQLEVTLAQLIKTLQQAEAKPKQIAKQR